MNTPLPFSNWSLKRAIESESDNFVKTRIHIIYVVLVFSALKALIAIGVAIPHEQWRQAIRAIVMVLIYVGMIKRLLYKPASIKGLAHALIVVGITVVWSNVLVFSHDINLASIQFIYMIALSSFYTLGSAWGIGYSIMAVMPVVTVLFFRDSHFIAFSSSAEPLASPGYEIIVVLNFVSMILAHYLFFRALNTNIIEKEKLNDQLQRSIAEVTELAESRTNFLSTMSHELRTPLNSVVGITELLIDDAPLERQKENLNLLQYSSVDLLALINNILDFNKIDSDKQPLEQLPMNLTDFLHNICAVLRVKADNKKISLISDIDPELQQLCVLCDPTRFSQVIYNLAGNAIKFTDKGTVTVKLALISKTAEQVEVRCSVIDTGIGIHPANHEAIFELFAQGESNILRRYGGTGLGLAIVKKILRMFNSSIHLESAPGKGSNFSFTLQLPITDQMIEKTSRDAASDVNLSHLRMLIVEDNDLNRMIMIKQMANLGIQPAIVENGKEAINELIQENFDIVLMDLHMPVLDGYETIKQIRALPDPVKANMHIVAFTASVTEQQQIFQSGFNDYLYKPVNMSDLRTKLEKVATTRGVEQA